ncbi:MAG: 30S ribosomal protein S6 [Nitrospirae bacterium]|nr:30S ribosomal protein S6 [Nitrospirota bacterium]
MNFYENLIILEPTLDEKAADEAIEKIKEVIVKKGGEVLKTDKWGRKRLAYVLKKRKEGIYVLLIFKAPPLAIVELERYYKVFDPVIKFIFVKLKSKQVSAMLPALPPASAQDSGKMAPAAPAGGVKDVQ